MALVLPGLLSATQVQHCLESTEILPHMCELAESCGGPCAGMLCDELEGAAHDLATPPNGHLSPSGGDTGLARHVVLYLHRDGFLQAHCPLMWAELRAAMGAGGERRWRTRVVDLSVRCIELHTYVSGAGLLAHDHRDSGSELSMSVLLSDPSSFGGGHFITYNSAGEPIAHALQKGDAVLFRSEDRHNVAVVEWGMRQTLVVELWAGTPNVKDRFT